MDKDILGSKIKNATNANLIKLVVEHYLSQREKGREEGGLLSNNELDMAVQEANKRKIARKIDIVLTAEKSIAFIRFDLNEANLLLKLVVAHIRGALKGFDTIAGIYSYKWLKPKNEAQKEYQRAIVETLGPDSFVFDTKPDNLSSNWLLAIDTQVKKIKKCLVAIQRIEEWADYPIIRGVVEEQIKESRFNIMAHLGQLGDITNSLFHTLGDKEVGFDRVIYKLTFYSLSESDKMALNALCADADYDSEFLDQQEVLKTLFNGKSTLTEGAKEELAKHIIDRAHNKYVKRYQLYHYFANIPIAEIARHYLTSKGITISGKPLSEDQGADDEDTKTHDQIQEAVDRYVKENGTNTEQVLKEGLLKWIDKGLFDEHPPLCICEKELFDRWLKAKAEMQKTVQGLIDKGALQTTDKTTDKGEIIGESLYRLTGQPKLSEAVEATFYNKEFRAFIEKEVGLDRFIRFLDTVNNIIETHTKATDEEQRLMAGYVVSETKEKADGGFWGENSPFKEVPVENRGLTDKEYKEIEELVTFAKREYE